MRRARSSQAARASARDCPYPSDPALGKIIGGPAAVPPQAWHDDGGGRVVNRTRSIGSGRQNGWIGAIPRGCPIEIYDRGEVGQ
ncbi:MAG TPA: hypothetical protein VFB60_20975 [Ktedonobacteraceae bacterium]|nr:hypothetical protein [Ktedonobacteraceae bacterium]